MNGINKVKIEAVSIKEVKTGQHGDFWPYGIKVQGEWHNGILSSQDQVDGMLARKGKEVELFFYVDEKYGNKVRFVTDKDRKEQPKATEKAPKETSEGENLSSIVMDGYRKRIEALEERMDAYDENTKGFKTPITDQLNQDAKAPIDITDELGEPDDLQEPIDKEADSNLPF